MDAQQWDHIHDDDLPAALPAAQAEIRRLRSALLRVDDVLAAARSWEQLVAAVRRAREEAERALPGRRG